MNREAWMGLAFFLVVFGLVIWIDRADKNRQNREFEKRVELAKKETTKLCANSFFKIVVPGYNSGYKTVVVLAGEVISEGQEKNVSARSLNDKPGIEFVISSLGSGLGKADKTAPYNASDKSVCPQ